VKNPFLNERERRVRVFWRLLLQYVLFSNGAVVLAGVFGLVSLATLEDVGSGEDPGGTLATSPAFQTSYVAASLVGASASVWLAGRFFDRRPFSGFGLRFDQVWWLEFCFGLALGALLMTAIFFVELAAGWITVTGTFEPTDNDRPFALAILLPLVVFVCVGFYEELLSRGYQLQNMAEGFNFPSLGPRGAILLAWVLSSALFGLLHLSNPNASPISTLNITFAGLLLGTGYVLTGRLAIPIGLHITWNFFQGNVFGFPVSGGGVGQATMIATVEQGPDLMTGGAFGPEAGLVGVAAMVIASLTVLLWIGRSDGRVSLHLSLARYDPRSGPRARRPEQHAPVHVQA